MYAFLSVSNLLWSNSCGDAVTGNSFFFDLYISEYLAYVLDIWNLIYADIINPNVNA